MTLHGFIRQSVRRVTFSGFSGSSGTLYLNCPDTNAHGWLALYIAYEVTGQWIFFAVTPSMVKLFQRTAF